MITEQFVKDEFVAEVLRRDIGIIYKTQEEVAQRYFKVRTGTLRNEVSRHDFSLQWAVYRLSACIALPTLS